MSVAKKAAQACSIKPFGNYIAIVEEQHCGNIVLPLGTQTGDYGRGTVAAVGPGSFATTGVRIESDDVKPGDFVAYKLGRVLEIEDDGKKFKVVPESDLVCKLGSGK